MLGEALGNILGAPGRPEDPAVDERRLIHVPALRNTHLIRLGWNLIDCGSGLIFYLFSTFSCETILCEFCWTDPSHRLRLLPPRRGAPSVSQSAGGGQSSSGKFLFPTGARWNSTMRAIDDKQIIDMSLNDSKHLRN